MITVFIDGYYEVSRGWRASRKAGALSSSDHGELARAVKCDGLDMLGPLEVGGVATYNDQ
jgi:hypothetical protein